METSLKSSFAQIFSSCQKNLSCPNFGGAAAPLAPPARTPMFKRTKQISEIQSLMFAYSGLMGTQRKQGLHCNVTLM